MRAVGIPLSFYLKTYQPVRISLFKPVIFITGKARLQPYIFVQRHIRKLDPIVPRSELSAIETAKAARR
jgi:hypothetical protein